MENVRKNFPELIDAKCFDMTNGLPFDDNYAGIVIADLSLHYFSEETTFKISPVISNNSPVRILFVKLAMKNPSVVMLSTLKKRI